MSMCAPCSQVLQGWRGLQALAQRVHGVAAVETA